LSYSSKHLGFELLAVFMILRFELFVVSMIHRLELLAVFMLLICITFGSTIFFNLFKLKS
jgi:hypothetical protein